MRAGRKTICDSPTTALIAKFIRLGLTNRDAIKAAGIGETSFYEWLRRSESEPDSIFTEFATTIKKAIAERKAMLLNRIHLAAEGGATTTETRVIYDAAGNETGRVVTTRQQPPNWTAAAWILERCHPAEFGRRTSVNITDWRESLPPDLDPEAVERQFIALLALAATTTDEEDE